jgi:hypothetical protein
MQRFAEDRCEPISSVEGLGGVCVADDEERGSTIPLSPRRGVRTLAMSRSATSLPYISEVRQALWSVTSTE